MESLIAVTWFGARVEGQKVSSAWVVFALLMEAIFPSDQSQRTSRGIYAFPRIRWTRDASWTGRCSSLKKQEPARDHSGPRPRSEDPEGDGPTGCR